MKKTIPCLMMLLAFFVSSTSFSQSIKAKNFKELLRHTITLKQLTAGKFRTVYSGPKKEGGLLTCLHNKNADEFLFVDRKDDSTLQTITYYIPDYASYNKLYQALKANAVNTLKQGLTLYEDNGKKYYQLVIQM